MKKELYLYSAHKLAVNHQHKQSHKHKLIHHPLYPQKPKKIVFRLDKLKSKLAIDLHDSAGCPTKKTFIYTINNGHFIKRTSLTSKTISILIPFSLPTLKGHLEVTTKKLLDQNTSNEIKT